MSYIKNTWTNGDVITAEKLNHIENGIGSYVISVVGEVDTEHSVEGENIYYNFPITWNAVKEALLDGKIVTLVALYTQEGYHLESAVVSSISLYDNIYAVETTSSSYLSNCVADSADGMIGAYSNIT